MRLVVVVLVMVVLVAIVSGCGGKSTGSFEPKAVSLPVESEPADVLTEESQDSSDEENEQTISKPAASSLLVVTKKPGHFGIRGQDDWFETGKSIKLPPGKYKVTTAIPGYLNETVDVTVKPGSQARVEIAIKPNPMDTEIIEGAPVPMQSKPKPAASVNLAAEKKAVLQVIRGYMQSHLSKADREARPKEKYYDWRFAGDWCAVRQTLYLTQWDHESEPVEFILRKKADKWQVVLTIEDYMTGKELARYGITADIAKRLKMAYP